MFEMIHKNEVVHLEEAIHGNKLKVPMNDREHGRRNFTDTNP